MLEQESGSNHRIYVINRYMNVPRNPRDPMDMDGHLGLDQELISNYFSRENHLLRNLHHSD